MPESAKLIGRRLLLWSNTVCASFCHKKYAAQKRRLGSPRSPASGRGGVGCDYYLAKRDPTPLSRQDVQQLWTGSTIDQIKAFVHRVDLDAFLQ